MRTITALVIATLLTGCVSKPRVGDVNSIECKAMEYELHELNQELYGKYGSREREANEFAGIAIPVLSLGIGAIYHISRYGGPVNDEYLSVTKEYRNTCMTNPNRQDTQHYKPQLGN